MQWTQILAHLTSHGWRWATENRLDGLSRCWMMLKCALPIGQLQRLKSHESSTSHHLHSMFERITLQKLVPASCWFIWEVMLAISCHIAADGFKSLNDHSHLMKDVAINRVPLLSWNMQPVESILLEHCLEMDRPFYKLAMSMFIPPTFAWFSFAFEFCHCQAIRLRDNLPVSNLTDTGSSKHMLKYFSYYQGISVQIFMHLTAYAAQILWIYNLGLTGRKGLAELREPQHRNNATARRCPTSYTHWDEWQTRWHQAEQSCCFLTTIGALRPMSPP